MGFFAALSASDPRVCGKARSLALLAAAGLQTPEGFVLLDEVFRSICPIHDWPEALNEEGLGRLREAEIALRKSPWPESFLEKLHQALSSLGATRFSVRSSFVGEDVVGRLAAGVYTSVLDVSPENVPDAIREVLCSAIAPGAIAYDRTRGIDPVTGPLCVLIHVYLPGEAVGSAATTGDEFILDCRRGTLDEGKVIVLREALLSWAKHHGPTEIEWVMEGGALFFLQARPYSPPRPVLNFPGFAELTADDPPALAWHWDAAHNPLPLSPAQQGLVEIADKSCLIGIRQRVLGGYLFYTDDSRPLPPNPSFEDASTMLMTLRSSFEARRAELGTSPNLEEAITLFLSVYQPLFGIIQPVVRTQRDALCEFLRQHHRAALSQLGDLLRDVPSVASERRSLATHLGIATEGEARERALQQYRDRFGDEAPLWDLSEPTFGESPTVPIPRPLPSSRVDWRTVADTVESGIPEALWPEYREVLANARKSMALAEEDDWLYARAQACIRRALQVLAVPLCAEGMLSEIDDIFFLPLAEIRTWLVTGRPSFEWKVRVAGLRDDWEKARQRPPIVTMPGKMDGLVHGIGIGGRVVGRVQIHEPGQWQGRVKQRVLVARTLLPTELPLLDAQALVVETGGLLDHVAVQARERGLPAIVGAVGASAILSNGDMVLVDADQGLVIRLGGTRNP